MQEVRDMEKMAQRRDTIRVPDYSLLANVEVALRRFVDAMRFKLLKNAKKGRWEDLSLSETLDRLEIEVQELRAAIQTNNSIEILLEAADVANFAMIAASIAVEKGAQADV
jgi:hypothetical protein